MLWTLIFFLVACGRGKHVQPPPPPLVHWRPTFADFANAVCGYVEFLNFADTFHQQNKNFQTACQG